LELSKPMIKEGLCYPKPMMKEMIPHVFNRV
jgi:hypothetical protein